MEMEDLRNAWIRKWASLSIFLFPFQSIQRHTESGQRSIGF